MKNKTILPIFFTCILLIVSSGFAVGGTSDSTKVSPKLYVNAGVYFPESTTTFRVDGQNGLGTLIFVEEFLHMERHPLVFTANLIYKASRRSIISARYFYYHATGEFKISEDLTIRDTVINVGAYLKSDWTNNYFGLNYNYAIFSKKEWSAGLSLGLRASMLKIKLEYGTNTKSGEYKTSLPLPIALWGLFVEGYMAPRLRGSYSFEMFRLSMGGIGGLVYENRFGLEYYFLKNLGAGISYNQILYRINEIPFNDRFDGNVSYSLNGLQLNLHARF